jgi:uncharacterized phage protein (TIGR01671 family)
MRTIKFRVWNKRTNKWVHGPGQEPNLFGETILLGGFMYGVGVLELNDCIACQYTGVNDKNGKEIYENDLLVFNRGEEWESKYPYTVVFKYGKFELKMPDSSMCIDIGYHKEMIISGNIFET